MRLRRTARVEHRGELRHVEDLLEKRPPSEATLAEVRSEAAISRRTSPHDFTASAKTLWSSLRPTTVLSRRSSTSSSVQPPASSEISFTCGYRMWLQNVVTECGYRTRWLQNVVTECGLPY